MKRLFVLLLAGLLLTGCADKAADSTPEQKPDAEPAVSEAVDRTEETTDEKSVLKAYEQAAKVYDWFDLCSPDCIGDPVEEDGNTYRQVDPKTGLNTYEDLKKQVQAWFAPELADKILKDSQNFRDIGGKLFCAEGARGSHMDLLDKTVTVTQQDPGHFTVELQFWTDSRLPDEASAQAHSEDSIRTLGYSTEALHFDRTDAGFRFTNFCPSDALDTEADTVFTFQGSDDAVIGENDSAWKMVCALLDANDQTFEPLADNLLDRFLKQPQEFIQALALLDGSPLRANDAQRHFTVDDVLTLPAVMAKQTPDQLDAFKKALETCQTENPAEKTVLDRLQEELSAS